MQKTFASPVWSLERKKPWTCQECDCGQKWNKACLNGLSLSRHAHTHTHTHTHLLMLPNRHPYTRMHTHTQTHPHTHTHTHKHRVWSAATLLVISATFLPRTASHSQTISVFYSIMKLWEWRKHIQTGPALPYFKIFDLIMVQEPAV